jgi:hypothetical protein
VLAHIYRKSLGIGIGFGACLSIANLGMAQPIPIAVPEGTLSVAYQYDLDLTKTNPTESIVSGTSTTIPLKDRSKKTIVGELHLRGNTVWTIESEKGQGIKRVDAILNGRFVSFTLDSKDEMSIQPTGILFEEGHGGFSAVELLNRCLFARGPVGSGLNWNEVLSGYSLTEDPPQGDRRTWKGSGPRPYKAEIVMAPQGLAVISFRSTEPSYMFERRTEYSDWRTIQNIPIPMKARHRFLESLKEGNSAGSGTDIKIQFSVTKMLPVESASPPLQDGMIFYKFGDDGSKSTFRFQNREFVKVSDPGNVPKSNVAISAWVYIVLGLVIASLLAFAIWRWYKTR